MATIQIPDDLAPGFRILPGGNISYSVAEDYPKQMAQISAEYAARSANPRYNPFGESPDSPRRLELELVDPFRAAFAQSQTRPVAPRYFETGGDIVSIDPRTGRVSTVYDTPTRDYAAENIQKSRVKFLEDEIGELRKARLTNPTDRPSTLTDEVLDAQIADRTTKLEALFNNPTTAARPQAAPVSLPPALMAFGATDTPLTPITSSAAPLVRSGGSKWVRDSSGKLVRSQ